MTKAAALRTILRRPIKPSDLPIIVRRRTWANLLAAIFVPMLIAVSGALLWLFVATEPFRWQSLFLLLLSALSLLLCGLAIDVIGFRIIIDTQGVAAVGLLTRRQFGWSDITHVNIWLIVVKGIRIGYQAVIHVDGRNQPKRLARNLFFAGHFMPPKMELGGKDLAKLLTKAKRQLEEPAITDASVHLHPGDAPEQSE